MGEALPTRLRERVLLPLWRSRTLRYPYPVLQNPLLASGLFVGLIVLWLRPAVHFDAMLSAPLYQLMSWSMVIDGVLFWWLMIDPRPLQPQRTLRYPIRILMLWAIMLPQIAIGAHIALGNSELFDVYSVRDNARRDAADRSALPGAQSINQESLTGTAR
jgi:putative membrane protein